MPARPRAKRAPAEAAWPPGQLRRHGGAAHTPQHTTAIMRKAGTAQHPASYPAAENAPWIEQTSDRQPHSAAAAAHSRSSARLDEPNHALHDRRVLSYPPPAIVFVDLFSLGQPRKPSRRQPTFLCFHSPRRLSFGAASGGGLSWRDAGGGGDTRWGATAASCASLLEARAARCPIRLADGASGTDVAAGGRHWRHASCPALAVRRRRPAAAASSAAAAACAGSGRPQGAWGRRAGQVRGVPVCAGCLLMVLCCLCACTVIPLASQCREDAATPAYREGAEKEEPASTRAW